MDDNKPLTLEGVKEALHESQNQMKRELDSCDDFEHLGHDISPQKIRQGLIDNDIVTTTVTSDLISSSTPKMENLLDFDDNVLAKDPIKAFLEAEREPMDKHNDHVLERFSDHSDDEFKQINNEDSPYKSHPFDLMSEPLEPFRDVRETIESPPTPEPKPEPELEQETIMKFEMEPEPLPERDYPSAPVPLEPEVTIQSPVTVPSVEKFVEKPVEKPVVKTPDLPIIEKSKIEVVKENVCKMPQVCEKPKKSATIDAEVFFCKMGLNTWFNPERLNPKVESLIYWRDPKKSGPVFGGVLIVLLALTYFSLISVIAYLSLIAITSTISFRIYKNVLQAVQKTGEGHPFKEFLEFDLTLSQDKVKEIIEIGVAHFNAAIMELRRLFLVEDLIDSLKFATFLWTLTYLGAWFNGMTLIIIAWVSLFTLPKVYETNKTQIDANLDIVRTKIVDITSKVKAAIPIGKKSEEKKEQ